MRWYVRSVDAPKPETLENAWHSLVSWVTGRKTPWELEAEEAAEEAAHAATVKHGDSCHDGKHADACKAASDDARSVSSSVASAMELRHRKRRMTVLGLSGVYVVWTIFAWFIFTCASCAASTTACAAPAADSSACAAQTACWCTNCWVKARSSLLRGPGGSPTPSGRLLSMRRAAASTTLAGKAHAAAPPCTHACSCADAARRAAARAQDVIKEVLRAAFVLFILERLHFTRPASWLEARAPGAPAAPSAVRALLTHRTRPRAGARRLPRSAGAAVPAGGAVHLQGDADILPL